MQVAGRRSQVARQNLEVHANGQRYTDFEKKTDCFAVLSPNVFMAPRKSEISLVPGNYLFEVRFCQNFSA